jgi:hypothetical protein
MASRSRGSKTNSSPSEGGESDVYPIVVHNQFSPIPHTNYASGAIRQGNLTGSARKLKDAAVDIHQVMGKWSHLQAEGMTILSDMANIKTEALLLQQQAVGDAVGEDGACVTMPTSLQPLCDQLAAVLSAMVKLGDKMSAMAAMMEGVHRLESYHTTKDQRDGGPVLFQTWTTADFVTCVHQLSAMYQLELQVKTVVMETICHARTRDAVMFHSACWLHQPYLDNSAKLLMEGLLLETGHR